MTAAMRKAVAIKLLSAGLLSLSACTPVAAPGHGPAVASPTGTVWKAEDVGGGGIIDGSHITLALGPDAVANGSGGCNRYTARYALAGDRLTITEVASTERACAPALMQQEARYAALLARVARWRIEPTGALVLTTTDGAPLRYFPDKQTVEAAEAALAEP